jgi:hypothetical protein
MRLHQPAPRQREHRAHALADQPMERTMAGTDTKMSLPGQIPNNTVGRETLGCSGGSMKTRGFSSDERSL